MRSLRRYFVFCCIVVVSVIVIACSEYSKKNTSNSYSTGQGSSALGMTYSRFGMYQALPEWSDWCFSGLDPTNCIQKLEHAVDHQTSDSRPTVRAHGWKLWAGITSPMDNSGYDLLSNTSTKFGTSGCWSVSSNHSDACSGVFPLWLTWPNTGAPYHAGTLQASTASHTSHQASPSLLSINRGFSDEVSTVHNHAVDPDPTVVQTVNTVDTPPVYPLPVLTVMKQCGLPENQAKLLVDAANKTKGGSPEWQALEAACDNNGAINVVCASGGGICDGNAFVNQGDVMIASESLSAEAWNAIQNHKLYGSADTLETIYKENDKEKASTQVSTWLPNEYVSTKHMFWPVKGCKPGVKVGDKGCRVRYGALPPWVPESFKDKDYSTNAQYLGYEKWGKVVAIDTCGSHCPQGTSATLVLEDVSYAQEITTVNPDIYSANNFVHIQISEEALQQGFSAADRALLDQATIWAYGSDSNGFEAGDFLVNVAMHITTKEVDTWAFQSTWWSPMNDTVSDCAVDQYNHCFGQSDVYDATSSYSGLSSAEITALNRHVGTQWHDYYVLTDSYGINYEIDGTPTKISNYFSGTPPKWATQKPTGEKVDLLPVSMNVYIEPVIHPIGSNCQNCHRRAGIVAAFPTADEYAAGVGRANYQTSQCPSLLADYGAPATDSCLLTPWAWNQSNRWAAPARNQCKEKDGTLCKGNEAYPIVNTDTVWLIADKHIQKAR